MDAASALADLTEISSQLEAAVLVDGDGAILASTIAAETGTDRLARGGLALIEAAEARFGTDGRTVTAVEAALREGSIFAARDGELAIVARTGSSPSSGLVLYDLKACLRSVAQDRGRPRSSKQTKKETERAGA